METQLFVNAQMFGHFPFEQLLISWTGSNEFLIVPFKLVEFNFKSLKWILTHQGA